jgi:hypothetical protein
LHHLTGEPRKTVLRKYVRSDGRFLHAVWPTVDGGRKRGRAIADVTVASR